MKKSLILVGMLAIGYANAQEGTVGINTSEPKATLDIQPNATNLTGTTNEGIIAPRLSKTRIANIEASKLTEGTLVYATDETTSPISAYTGADAKVAKITEKGYYFYNGTEWVKAGADITNLLWEKEATTNNIRLKETISGDNHIFYNTQGGLNVIPKTLRLSNHYNGQLTELKPISLTDNYYGNSTNLKIAYADKLKGSDASLSQWEQAIQFMNTDRLIVDENNTTSSYNVLITKENSLDIVESSTKKYNTLIGTRSSVYNKGKGQISSSLIGGYNRATHANGNANTIMGAYNQASVGDNFIVNSLYGAQNRISIDMGEATSKLDLAIASYNHISVNKDSSYPIGDLIGSHQSVSIPTEYKGSINKLFGVAVNFTNISQSTEKINENFGVYISNITKGKNKNYGLLIEDVGRTGATDNYSVYTRSGQIRFGDLADASATTDRTVVVDKDGVLKTGSAANIPAVQVGSTTSMTCNDVNRGKMNFVKDVDLGGGKTADAFAVCLKGSDSKHYWRYLYGGAGMHNGTETFGTGLQ